VSEVAVNGTVLHYEEAGDGDPLLLLHGGGSTALLSFHREIAELGEVFHVIAPDLRGYGHSSPPRTFEDDFYARDAVDMAALLEALDIGPMHVCGWSDGGIVALVLAADHPERVRTLVVWGAEAHVGPEERGYWPRFMNTSDWTDQALERFARAQGPLNWPGLFDRMLEGYVRLLESGGNIVADRLDRVRCPTLIMHGDEDGIVPVARAYELNRLISGSELYIFHGAGHDLHRERHHELMDTLHSFLRRQYEAEQTEEEQRPQPAGTDAAPSKSSAKRA
jgi:valacyclovir hydrolase